MGLPPYQKGTTMLSVVEEVNNRLQLNLAILSDRMAYLHRSIRWMLVAIISLTVSQAALLVTLVVSR